ncbi:ABC transporter permease subunit, partial [Oceanicola sp. S124]|uniref:ABC transporter permease subunit n=1 Tax=Oceanicola sp. S124 TaxID=1042378 RepID=UPI0002559682
MLNRLLPAVAMALCLLAPATPGAAQETIQPILQEQSALILESSRRTIQPAIDAIAASGLPQATEVLETWAARDMWQRVEDGAFFRAERNEDRSYTLHDFDTGESFGPYDKDALEQLKPNSGIQALIGAALVRFQLSDPDPATRAGALDNIDRNGEASHMEPLAASIATETDPDLKARKERLLTLLTIRFARDKAARIAAIESVAGNLDVAVRATLNPLVATTLGAGTALPEGRNIAAELRPGSEALPRLQAYELLVSEGLAPKLVTSAALRGMLAEHLSEGRVAGVPVGRLSDPAARREAFAGLVEAGLVEPAATEEDIDASLAAHVFYQTYAEADADVTAAAEEALTSIDLKVGVHQFLDLGLDALSLGSIYFLAAIGLAITFGVMGVINMAHGEFIMMGAYTGYVLQQVIPDYTVSILLAIPLAFAVTFAAGVAM